MFILLHLTLFRLSLGRTFLKGRGRWADPTFMSVPSEKAEELHRHILSFIIIFLIWEGEEQSYPLLKQIHQILADPFVGTLRIQKNLVSPSS